MGLSIHYSGKFNKNESLSDFITEIEEIAKVFEWEYNIFQKHFPRTGVDSELHDGKIYGISFTPPECETVSLCFLSNYRMSSNVHLKFYGNSTNKNEKDFLYMLSVKTQFASIDIHKTIIEIFKHIKNKKYFEELSITDDGQYWETGNENLLEQKFKENGSLIDNFSLAVETIPIDKEESFDKYFERIIRIIDTRTKSPNA